ncbi:DUF1365 domain-containing protein [Planctomycetes bacterium K23_9]|uniref:DUF1365 domain-containing protein n=1 Tax=Stieleria marina TaxID=1930275 RepID=A0A517NRH9_9BACT|nr:hypothetical protein K239x_16980 [Planctomycetes bacterium K23_9]
MVTTNLKSCLYRGYVRHRRKSPKHAFTYSSSWVYLDLDEVEGIIDSSWLLGRRRFSPAAFRRSDHLGSTDTSLQSSIRELVEQKTGQIIDGPIRILTQLSHFGVYFSPINLYYCFDRDDELVVQVAEVSNTPWNERHYYVLWAGNRVDGSQDRYSHAKEFHVSPFMGMDSTYQWKTAAPGDECVVSLGCDRDGKRIFQALLRLQSVPLTNHALLVSLLRRPIAAVHIVGAIYFQALRLWMKRCQFFPRPNPAPLPTTIDPDPEAASREAMPCGPAVSRKAGV